MPAYPPSLFYDLLFGKASESHYVSLWSGKSKLSRHVAAGPDGYPRFQAAVDSLGPADVYVGLATRRPGLHSRQRGKAGECIGLGCAWLDVDRADDSQAHKAKNLPRDLDDLVAIIEARPHEPDLIVDSGHGWHVYWILTKFVTLGVPGRTVVDANRQGQIWQAPYIKRAADLGWHVDQTGNLDRVLRVPGTLNVKADPVPVSILVAA